MQRTALVTGAAAGIGKAIAIRLAKEGKYVGVLDINLEGCQAVVDEIAAAGGQAIALKASVTSRAEIDAAVDKLRAAFGPVCIVVNNAGITSFTPFRDVTEDALDQMLAVNVKGPFMVTQAVLPDMEAARWGRIVNISSSSAQTGAHRMTAYSASKGAIVTLTRSLALELGPLGITVNNIPPGSVMQTEMSEANRALFPSSPEDQAKMLPVRRTGIPNDIANACSFLVSEESSYITGQTIGVNGGRVTTT